MIFLRINLPKFVQFKQYHGTTAYHATTTRVILFKATFLSFTITSGAPRVARKFFGFEPAWLSHLGRHADKYQKPQPQL